MECVGIGNAGLSQHAQLGFLPRAHLFTVIISGSAWAHEWKNVVVKVSERLNIKTPPPPRRGFSFPVIYFFHYFLHFFPFPVPVSLSFLFSHSFLSVISWKIHSYYYHDDDVFLCKKIIYNCGKRYKFISL